MASVIWKFPFAITDESVIEIPRHHKIIHVGLDPTGTPCVWAIVDPDSPRISKTLYIAGTGHRLNEFQHFASHLGSFVQGPFVWHVFHWVVQI